jgi:hypothetical protein
MLNPCMGTVRPFIENVYLVSGRVLLWLTLVPTGAAAAHAGVGSGHLSVVTIRRG